MKKYIFVLILFLSFSCNLDLNSKKEQTKILENTGSYYENKRLGIKFKYLSQEYVGNLNSTGNYIYFGDNLGDDNFIQIESLNGKTPEEIILENIQKQGLNSSDCKIVKIDKTNYFEIELTKIDYTTIEKEQLEKYEKIYNEYLLQYNKALEYSKKYGTGSELYKREIEKAEKIAIETANQDFDVKEGIEGINQIKESFISVERINKCGIYADYSSKILLVGDKIIFGQEYNYFFEDGTFKNI